MQRYEVSSLPYIIFTDSSSIFTVHINVKYRCLFVNNSLNFQLTYLISQVLSNMENIWLVNSMKRELNVAVFIAYNMQFSVHIAEYQFYGARLWRYIYSGIKRGEILGYCRSELNETKEYMNIDKNFKRCRKNVYYIIAIDVDKTYNPSIK